LGTSFDVDEVIFQMMRDYGYATVPGVAAIADVTERTVRRHISPLVAEGKIIATGTTRDRRYLLPFKTEQ
jgi:DeoR/GlpR family transcriptional regulator of sugar metabolism